MSYLTFKIISIIVMIVILIVVVSNKRNQRNIKATNQQDNSDLPETIDYSYNVKHIFIY